MLRARGRHRSRASWAREWHWVHNVAGSGRTMLLRAQERRCGLSDGACVVDGVTDSGLGRWRRVKGLDRGGEQWHGGSEDDSTMVRRLLGGLDDGTCSEEVDDDVGSREIFGGKFWQPNGVSEILWGLGFAKGAQQFIYRRITVEMGIGDISRAIVTENHSSNGWLPSAAHC
jgi:hypothetical protein